MGNNQIPHYHLFIHPLDITDLRRDIWCDDPVPAVMKFNKRKFEIDIVYRGSHIREFDKKSYFVSFHKPSLFRKAKEWHLNAEFKDPSLLRNKLSLDFFAEIGNLAPQSRYVFLVINGRKEGVYLEIESVDEYFLQKRGLPSGSIHYAIDGDANLSLMSDLDKKVKDSLLLGYERKLGMDMDDDSLQEMILMINTTSREEFEKKIHVIMNVDKYLRWLAGIIFTQNYDGFVHNYALYRNRENGQFEIIPWDYDATWGRDVNGKTMEEDYVRIQGFNTLSARILDIEHYRKQYKNLLETILKEYFTIEHLRPKIETMYELIRPYVLLDPYKKEKLDEFDREPEFILNYIEVRSKYIKNQLTKLD
ncbi:CotH kinase family protein [Cytobacillus sp. Hz8]|uniref:CotH kinase family protein n=1 Tax=Cytobacillus sp. Hz8 TaxID=3347168 RepID=UPI0035DFAE56